MSKRTKIIIGACFAGFFALVLGIAVLGACWSGLRRRVVEGRRRGDGDGDVERKGEDGEEAREQQQYGKDGENVLSREVKVEDGEKCG